MKKILSLVVVISIIMGMFAVNTVAIASAGLDGYYANVDFEDGKNPFVLTSGAGGVEVVDGQQAGVGRSGNVLKFNSGLNSKTYIDMAFDEAIAVDKPLVFETKFRAATEMAQYLFRLRDNANNKNKEHGLVRLMRPSGCYDLSVNPSDADYNNTSDCFKDSDGNPILINSALWYGVKVIYDNTLNGGTILSLEFYDENGELIQKGENFLTQNSGWPLKQIDTVGFWTQGWTSDEIIYLDDIKVYEYSEEDTPEVPDVPEIEDEELPEGTYINANFENGTNPFEISSGTGSATVVDGEEFGADGKVLKFSSGLNSKTYLDMTFDNPISVDKTLAFETKFRVPTENPHYLFRLYDSVINRNKGNGLVRLVRPGGMYDLSVNPSSDTYNDATNCLKDADGNPILIDVSSWYKIRVIYDCDLNGGTILSMELYDADGNLLQSGKNYSTQNAAWPLSQIDTIGFWTQGWSSEEIIYLDDVKVYEYSPLEVSSEFESILNPEATEIVVPFNKELDPETADSVAIDGIDAAAAEIMDIEAIANELKITFASALTPSASYVIDISGLKALDGSEAIVTEISFETTEKKPDNMYIDEDFENEENPFEITSGAGSATVIDGETVGTDGKVLKFNAGLNSKSYLDFILDEPISVDKTLVFETKFKVPGEYSQFLFTLYDTEANKNKSNGLVRLVRPAGMYDLSVNPSSDAYADATDCLKDADGNPILIDVSAWYKVKVIYDCDLNGGTILSMELYDAEGNLLESGNNYSTQNAAWPLTQINKIGFWSQNWTSNESIYLDDIMVYEYEEIQPLAFEGANINNGSEISPVEFDGVVVDFSERISKSSLDKFVVTANGKNVEYNAKLTGDSTTVRIDFEDALIGGAEYIVDYSNVCDINGSSVAGSIKFNVLSGIFVKNIAFTSGNIVAGKDVSATIEILNCSGKSDKVTAIAAVYEEIEGSYRLVSVSPYINTDVKEGYDTIDVGVRVPSDVIVAKTNVKVMVLDSMASLKPLGGATELPGGK